MDDQKWIYRLGLSFVDRVGGIRSKKLISYCGSAEAIFKERSHSLLKIPGVGRTIVKQLNSGEALKKAEQELKYVHSNDLQMLYFMDENYPNRLKQCPDSPIILFCKGNVNLNTLKTVAIVGTRNATRYGKDFTQQLIERLLPNKPLIVSGLAHGIDIAAHKGSLSFNLPTVAVIAHGLDRIYPAEHKRFASDMIANGALISEYPSGTPSLRDNFQARNRIIAGLSDAVVVVESAMKGGALITADFANQYNREVFALPGRVNDGYSEGCHYLIKSHKAHLLTDVTDIENLMNWDQAKKKRKQIKLDFDLSPNEKMILDLLKDGPENIDSIATKGNLPLGKLSEILLNLEFSGRILSHPGKIFELN